LSGLAEPLPRASRNSLKLRHFVAPAGAAIAAGPPYATGMDRRLELQGWIAQTRHHQRRLAIGLLAAAALALALAAWRPSVGGIGLGVVAIVALCGFWVTSSHVADWHSQLEQLDRRPRPPGSLDRRG
jgi:hypothetical protein